MAAKKTKPTPDATEQPAVAESADLEGLKKSLAAREADNASLRQQNGELGAFKAEALAARETIEDLTAKLADAEATATSATRAAADHAAAAAHHERVAKQNGAMAEAAQMIATGLKKLVG